MLYNFSPLLNIDWIIRGTAEKPRLVNYKNSKIIPLIQEIFKLITLCNGKNHFNEIIKLLGKYTNVEIL